MMTTTTTTTLARAVDFGTPWRSFSRTRTSELLRKALVLAACRESVVTRAPELLAASRSVLGPALTRWAVRRSFFESFCAGETEAEARRTMARLREEHGVRGILDFAAEQDVASAATAAATASAATAAATAPADGDIPSVALSRQYTYLGEDECDRRVAEFETSIRAAGEGGFAAVKMTALGSAELLRHVSRCTLETRALFQRMAGGKTTINKPDFVRAFDDVFTNADTTGERLFDEIMRSDNLRRKWNKLRDIDEMDIITWTTSMRPRQVVGLARAARPGVFSAPSTNLSESDLDRVDSCLSRLEALAWTAKDAGARLMIDAEQTYFNPIIESATLDLQRRLNDSGDTGAVIFSTYQAYNRETASKLELDLARADREGWRFACKLVRGAYMHQERALAAKEGVDSPIHNTIQETAQSYDKCARALLTHAPEVEVVFATHNLSTIESLLPLLDALALKFPGWVPHNVSFAQLYGMADNISFSLARAGLPVYKYLPFGSVDDVVPYLVRRAQENSSVSENATAERRMLMAEVLRRMRFAVGLEADPPMSSSLASSASSSASPKSASSS